MSSGQCLQTAVACLWCPRTSAILGVRGQRTHVPGPSADRGWCLTAAVRIGIGEIPAVASRGVVEMRASS